MRYVLLAAALLVASPAFAQQPPSPTALAIQINNAINNMALQLETLQQQNTALTKENSELKAKSVKAPETPAAKK